jgi:D-lactate dehydrogenase (cytochrome)
VTTPRGGCVLDVSRMDAVLAVRPGDLDATVQAGVRWQELNKLLAPHGLFFPVDPGPGACIGGRVGTGCSGTNAMRHGAMKANVVALECVLADGSLVKTASRARKSSAGFDLTSLMTGSEGTLGVVTAATLRLAPLPAATAVAVSSFPNVGAAAACAAALLRAGVPVAALELLDAPMVGVVNAQSGFAYPPQPLLLFKLAGASEARVADDARRVEALAAEHGGSAFDFAADEAGRERLWEARKVALWSAGAQHPGKRIATTDVCVPLSRLPELMRGFEELARGSALPVYAVAHAGDGNAHHFIVFDAERPAEVAEAKRLNSLLVRRAIALEGTCTGEHGVGVGKVGYLAGELGEGNLRAMRSIKRALDPQGLLNPGKKIPAGEAAAAAGGGEAAPDEAELPLFVGAPACMQ